MLDNLCIDGFDKEIPSKNFIDIRPKKHALPVKFRNQLTDMVVGDNNFYKRLASLYSDDIIYSLFTGITTDIYGKNLDIVFEFKNNSFLVLPCLMDHMELITKLNFTVKEWFMLYQED